MITSIISYLVLEKVGSGVEIFISRRGTEIHIFVLYAASLFFVGYSLFSLVRAVAFVFITKRSFWRKNIWDIVLGPIPDNREK